MPTPSSIPEIRVRVELADIYDIDYEFGADDVAEIVKRVTKAEVEREVRFAMEKFRGKVLAYLEPRLNTVFQSAVDRLDAVPDDELVIIALDLEEKQTAARDARDPDYHPDPEVHKQNERKRRG